MKRQDTCGPPHDGLIIKSCSLSLESAAGTTATAKASTSTTAAKVVSTTTVTAESSAGTTATTKASTATAVSTTTVATEAAAREAALLLAITVALWGKVYPDLSVVDHLSVELDDGRLGIHNIVKLGVGETARLAGFAVRDDADIGETLGPLELALEPVLVDVVGEATDEQSLALFALGLAVATLVGGRGGLGLLDLGLGLGLGGLFLALTLA